MGGSTREDFLLRQVRLFAACLARALGLASGGQVGEAAHLLQQAETGLLGEKGRVIRLLDTASGAALLDNPRLIFAMAQLCAAEATLARQRERPGEPPTAGEGQPLPLERQALEYALEAWRREPDLELLEDFIRAASSRVPPAALAAPYRELLESVPQA